MDTMLRVSAMATLLVLAACSRPPAPDTDKPPEPQAARAQATDLRDAIQAPQDKARANIDFAMPDSRSHCAPTRLSAKPPNSRSNGVAAFSR